MDFGAMDFPTSMDFTHPLGHTPAPQSLPLELLDATVAQPIDHHFDEEGKPRVEIMDSALLVSRMLMSMIIAMVGDGTMCFGKTFHLQGTAAGDVLGDEMLPSILWPYVGLEGIKVINGKLLPTWRTANRRGTGVVVTWQTDDKHMVFVYIVLFCATYFINHPDVSNADFKAALFRRKSCFMFGEPILVARPSVSEVERKSVEDSLRVFRNRCVDVGNDVECSDRVAVRPLESGGLFQGIEMMVMSLMTTPPNFDCFQPVCDGSPDVKRGILPSTLGLDSELGLDTDYFF